MNLRAVTFDLFGTLVDNWPVGTLNAMHARVAEMIGAPPEEFIRLWVGSWSKRMTGGLPTTEDTLVHLCSLLGVSPTGDQLAAATAYRLQVARESFRPRPDAVTTLAALRLRGLKLGMVSNCTWETVAIWKESVLAPLFDAAVFSCVVKMKKPDPGIYLLTCDRLGIRPSECLYVGDGGSREITGAAAVGMRPVLIRVPYETADEVYRVEVEEWEGARVEALQEVLGLV